MKTQATVRRRPQPLCRGLPLEIVELEGGLRKPLWRPPVAQKQKINAIARPKLRGRA